MKSIIKNYFYPAPEGYKLEKVSSDMITLIPEDGVSYGWKCFAEYFEKPEPSKPVVNPRRHRACFYKKVDGKGYYIKKLCYRYSDRLKDRFRGFRLFSSWALKQMVGAIELKKTGVKVVEPVMVLEKFYFPFKQESILVTKETPGGTLQEVIKSDLEWEEKLALLDIYFREIAIMHKHNITFGATQPRNVIVKEGGWYGVILTA